MTEIPAGVSDTGTVNVESEQAVESPVPKRWL